MHEPRDFTQFDQLVDAALDQPEAQRARWIDALPPEIGPLKQRLRELLARKPFETLPKLHNGLDDTPSEIVSDRPGDSIGPYCLERVLGCGGMGTVWLARRADGLLSRDVALKIPHGTWQRAGLSQRMASERHILAALCHSNIGRLYDAGIAADGRPYLALEYIEGEPIDEYCRERDLALHARLKLFEQVAAAVAYAHSKLIVHRDLKPANILVTPAGEVRLLDFGIAKLLDDGRGTSTALTELSGRVMTPDYAAPEQILGEPISTAADIYSLGVVLYELLTDRRPYELKRGSRSALEDAIVQCEPRRPSEVASSRTGARMLRGDLDTIVMKALKKSPQERYATMNALADDIGRYLAGRPVLARPDTVAYRAHRFFGRHKLAVSAAAAVMLALLLGAAVALWQARLALEQRARAEQVKDFVVSTLRNADPYARARGQHLTITGQLLSARMRAEAELADQPQVQVELLAIIAESLKGIAYDQTAIAALEHASARARARSDSDPQLILKLHRMLAETYAEVGRLQDAKAQLQLALASAAMRTGEPNSEWVEVHLQRSVLAMEEARYDEALDAARTALRLARSTAGISTQLVAQAWRYSGVVHRARGDSENAIAEYRRAYELALEAYGRDTRHPFVMETRMGYARALLMQNRWREALEHMQGAVEAAQEVFGDAGVLTGNFLGSLGEVQANLGMLIEGVANCRKGVELYLGSAQPGTRDHASRLRLLGRALLAAGQYHEAALRLGEAVSMRAHLNDPYELPAIRAGYVLALIRTDQLERAEAELALIDTDVLGARTETLLEAMLYRNVLLHRRGRSVEALAGLESALELAKGKAGFGFAQSQILHGLASIDLDTGHADRALDRYSQVIGLLQEIQLRPTPALADALAGRGRAYARLGRADRAIADLETALAIWTSSAPDTQQARLIAREVDRLRDSMQSSRDGLSRA